MTTAEASAPPAPNANAAATPAPAGQATAPEAGGTPVNPAPAAEATPTVVDYKFDPVEGFSAEFDQDVIAVAKELGLPQDAATKLRAYEIARAQEADKVEAEARTKAEAESAQKLAAFAKEIEDDTDYGRTKLTETQQRIDKLLKESAKTGLGAEIEKNPNLMKIPAFWRFLAWNAYSRADDNFVNGNENHTDTRSRADRMYAKTTPS